MAKNRPFYDHYRPHERVTAPTELFNPLTGEFFTPPDRTKQAHLRECDINVIIKQFSSTGMLSHISAKAAQGAYMDLPDPVDFQTAQNILIEGQEAFASLPSKLRDRFNNEPAQFLEFLQDTNNKAEAIELGLIPRPLPEVKAEAGASAPVDKQSTN